MDLRYQYFLENEKQKKKRKHLSSWETCGEEHPIAMVIRFSLLQFGRSWLLAFWLSLWHSMSEAMLTIYMIPKCGEARAWLEKLISFKKVVVSVYLSTKWRQSDSKTMSGRSGRSQRLFMKALMAGASLCTVRNFAESCCFDWTKHSHVLLKNVCKLFFL